MEEYKKYVDHQHAPESLIADTIKKVKAEEARKTQTQEAAKVTRMPQAAEMQKKKKKPFGKIMTAGMTAVAAAAAIAVLVQVIPREMRSTISRSRSRISVDSECRIRRRKLHWKNADRR